MGQVQEPAPLPPLLGHDDPASPRKACPDSHAILEGTALAPGSQLFEAKAVHLLPRPKTSQGMPRSPSAPALVSGTRQTPRLDKGGRETSATTLGGGGCVSWDGGERSRLVTAPQGKGSVRGAYTSCANGCPTSSLALSMLQPQEGWGSAQANADDRSWIPRARDQGSDVRRSSASYASSCQSRGQRDTLLRRCNSAASTGIGGSRQASSITASDDPSVLRGEIRRLQAALMNDFKGGNRFVGGAQFKASIRKQSNSCGGCLQVREALRRSRIETRELRGSLFQAETIIKQLTLTKAHRRPRQTSREMLQSIDGDRQRDAPFCASDEDIGRARLFHVGSKCSSAPVPSREELLLKVQQLEQDLCQTDARHSQSQGAAVSADDGLKDALATIESLKEGHAISSTSHPPSERQDLARRDQDAEPEETRPDENDLECENLALIGSLRGEGAEMREEMGHLRKRADNLCKVNVELESESGLLHAKIKRMTEELDQSKAQAVDHKEQVRRVSQRLDTLQAEALITAQRLAEKEADVVGVRASLELERSIRQQKEGAANALSRAVADERASSESMKGEMTAMKRARRLSESQAATAELAHRRALKTALSSCVRLCVVAPTVNINLNDRSRSFSSALPEGKVRKFVEETVLPRFTRVLLQPGGAGSAPPDCSRVHVDHEPAVDCRRGSAGGDTDGQQAEFDKWLRDLLIDMQSSIERHVASVFKTQTVAAGSMVARR